MNMLITGGCGFIGSNFIRYLLLDSDFDGRIINVDLLTYAGNPESLKDIEAEFSGRYSFVQADICDQEKPASIFNEFNIDTVCHFAAGSHVDRSIVAPDAFIQTNIIGTFNLLQIARDRQKLISRFHHISTDEVFGSLGADGFFKETTPYDPSSPYSASKASPDHLVRAYHRTYSLPVTISNCSNNYGPFQFPEKLIPLMVLNALEGKTLPVYGDGKNIRDWLYVEDHSQAIWEIIKRGKAGETYNIGGNCEMENITLVEMLCDMVDELSPTILKFPRRELITFVKDRPGHDRRYAIDATKLKNDLGWTPKIDLKSGLRKTIIWYMEHTDWVNRVKSGEYRRWIEQHYKSGV